MREPFLAKVDWIGTAVRVLGRVSLDSVDPKLEVALIERDGDRRLGFPAINVSPSDGGGELGQVWFEAAIDVAKGVDGEALPVGLWDVHIADGSVAIALGKDRAPDLAATPQRHFLAGSPDVTTYFGVGGGLSIDVGGQPHTAGSTRADSVAWNERDETFVVTGHLDFADHAMPISATLTLRERSTARIFEVIAMLDTDSERLAYTAQIPMTRAIIDDPLPRGTWDATLILSFSGMHREVLVLAPERPLDMQVWRRMRHVRVRTSPGPGPFTITVGNH